MKTYAIPYLSAFFFLSACSPTPTPPESAPETKTMSKAQTEYLVDIEALCETVSERYIYIDTRQDNWDLACAQAKIQLVSADTKRKRFVILENLLDAIYDNHAMLGANLDTSFKLIPSSADFWIEEKESRFTVTAIRPNSAAADAGLKIGDEVVTINSQTPEQLILSRLHPKGGTVSEQQRQWALVSAAQGRRNETRSITVLRGEERLSFPIDDASPQADAPLVEAKILDGNLAYLKINNQLGNIDTVDAFNLALETVNTADAWILDLRNTPGGGGTNIAVPIMNRFIETETPYQITVYKDKPSWTATAGNTDLWTAKGPMAVLVGRWTGSMGEGMAIGFDGMNRATVIGTDMARLAGGVDDFILPHSKIRYKIPTYNLTHIDGTNRHEWSPPVFITSDNGNDSDLALTEARQILMAELNQ